MFLSEFIKRGNTYDALKFWRTNDEKYEIDMVLDTEKKAYELKFKDVLKESDSR